jgi:septum formation protein
MQSGAFPLWRGDAPLVLASKSRSRQILLAGTNIPFDSFDAALDERAIEAPLRERGASPGEIALHLARQKAIAASRTLPGRLVLGADQLLCLNGVIFAKPANLEEAAAHLRAFSGKTHELHSAISLVQDEKILFEAAPVAKMTCRNFSENFIKAYIEQAGEAVLQSVGAYRIEDLGIHLFAKIEGDHTTILGLPLLPLLGFLRHENWLTG